MRDVFSDKNQIRPNLKWKNLICAQSKAHENSRSFLWFYLFTSTVVTSHKSMMTHCFLIMLICVWMQTVRGIFMHLQLSFGKQMLTQANKNHHLLLNQICKMGVWNVYSQWLAINECLWWSQGASCAILRKSNVNLEQKFNLLCHGRHVAWKKSLTRAFFSVNKCNNLLS